MRAITLDLWQTLITEGQGWPGHARHHARVAGVRSELASFGHPIAAERVDAALLKVRSDFDSDHDRGLDISFGERVRHMLAYVSPELPDQLDDRQFASVLAAVDQPFLMHPPKPVKGARAVLVQLRNRGHAIALISNTGFTSAAVYRTWLERLGWLAFFDVTSFSNDLAVAKPTRRIFETTLSAMGVAPAEALHVGDSGHHDVDGAHAAGLSTVWVRSGRQGEPRTPPDFVIDELVELPGVVRQWRKARRD